MRHIGSFDSLSRRYNEPPERPDGPVLYNVEVQAWIEVEADSEGEALDLVRYEITQPDWAYRHGADIVAEPLEE